MTGRIYRYVVKHDTGAAPNPFGGWCSLAVCKPSIRRTAQVGDWIVGLRSKAPDQVIYAMQVQERVSFHQYWRDARFRDKRPDRCLSSDNIYRPTSTDALELVPNAVHDARAFDRDTGGRWVLAGQRFWYFGGDSPQLPTELIHLVHSTQGHALHINRREDDTKVLARWLKHWRCGLHGRPIDEDRLTPLDSPPASSRCQPRPKAAPAPRMRQAGC